MSIHIYDNHRVRYKIANEIILGKNEIAIPDDWGSLEINKILNRDQTGQILKTDIIGDDYDDDVIYLKLVLP